METGSESFPTRQDDALRQSRLQWAVPSLLAACVIGIALIGVLLMTNHDSENVLAEDQVATINTRLDSMDRKLSSWSKDRTTITERMAQTEKSASSSAWRARTEAGALIEGVKRDMSRGFEADRSRLTGIESLQLELHDEVARLREELAAVRQELAAIREASAAAPGAVDPR
jgi:predicted  nucleic acid-binding Zn-ribbon protein